MRCHIQNKDAGHNGVLGVPVMPLNAVTMALCDEQGLVIEDLVFLMTVKEVIMNQEVVL